MERMSLSVKPPVKKTPQEKMKQSHPDSRLMPFGIAPKAIKLPIIAVGNTMAKNTTL